MPWVDTNKSLDCSAMVDNLLAFFTANQADALLWANGGVTSLKPFKSIADALADPSKPVFPALQFVDDNEAEDQGDALQSVYMVTFEAMIQNAVAATAIAQARRYRKAIKSMLKNIPDTTLKTNTGATAIELQMVESGFDPIKTNDQQNDFLQIFQIRATYLVVGAAY